MIPRPPRLWRWMIDWITPRSAEGLRGDLDEEFVRCAQHRGERAARRWYRKQALDSALPLLGLSAIEKGPAASMALLTGVVAYIVAVTTIYGLLCLASSASGAPLAALSPGVFLTGWVFGGSATAGWLAAVGTSDRSEYQSVRAAAVATTASLLLLLGIDEPMSVLQQILVATLAVLGTAAGDALGSIHGRRRRAA